MAIPEQGSFSKEKAQEDSAGVRKLSCRSQATRNCGLRHFRSRIILTEYGLPFEEEMFQEALFCVETTLTCAIAPTLESSSIHGILL